MIRGLYTAAAGMLAGVTKQEAVVHNLSNVRTTGYKADVVTAKDFPSLLLTEINRDIPGPQVGKMGTGITIDTITTNFDSGPLNLTENPYDLAIAGEGFFQLQTPNGIRYTRDGEFTRDVNGNLVNANGYYLLGTNGPVVVPQGQLTVSQTGTVLVDDAEITQLSLARFDDLTTLKKEGQNLFSDPTQTAQLLTPQQTKVYQGYLEGSNVDAAQMITEMTTVMRAYQFSQRMVQFQDRVNGQAATDLGRV